MSNQVEHIFGPGETIRAIIRKYNHMGMTETMLEKMMIEYNKLNESKIPKPGDKVKIPIFVGFVGMKDKKTGG